MVPVRRNQNWLPSIFNDFLGNDWLVERHNTTAPAVNIIEDENEYKVEVAAPGMTKEDFKVHINEDNELIVTMEKKAEQKEEDKKKGTYLRREFSYTKFQQSLLLPDNVVREKIAAKVENGVMTIEIPKKKETDRGQIACGHSMMGGRIRKRVLLFLCRPRWTTVRWRSAGMRNERNGRPKGCPPFVSVRGGEWGRGVPKGPGCRARRCESPSGHRILRPACSARSRPHAAPRNGL